MAIDEASAKLAWSIRRFTYDLEDPFDGVIYNGVLYVVHEGRTYVEKWSVSRIKPSEVFDPRKHTWKSSD